MKNRTKKLLSMVLAAALVLTSYGVYAEAKKNVKLSKSSITIAVKGTKTIKVLNSKKKAKWSIKKGSKYISLTKKKKSSVTVKGKKAGSAVVQAKVGSKKLTCKVKVKAATTNTQAAETPAPTMAPATTVPTQAPAGTTPTTEPTTEPTVAPTEEPAGPTAEPVTDLVIDMSKITTKVFSDAGNKLDLHTQIQADSRFDLSYYSSVVVNYVATFTDDDETTLAKGKVGIAEDESSLSGYGDGVACSYELVGGKTEVTVDVSKVEAGTKVYGLNIQPMTSEYKTPTNVKSIEITGVKFVAKKGATYPIPGSATPAPTATPGPTIVPTAFHYEDLDTSWIDSSKKLVAFTFDDGPVGTADTSTSMIIQKALVDHNAHATFNYIGQEIVNKGQAGIDEIKMAQENGFEIGCHSYTYDSLPANELKIKDLIGKTNALLTEITGLSNFTFRPPNLSVNATMKAYINAPFIMSSIDSKDWNSATEAQIITNVGKMQDGDIVLMHMTQKNTAAVIDTLLENAEDDGFQVVSVSELFAMKGKDLITGQTYSNAR